MSIGLVWMISIALWAVFRSVPEVIRLQGESAILKCQLNAQICTVVWTFLLTKNVQNQFFVKGEPIFSVSGSYLNRGRAWRLASAWWLEDLSEGHFHFSTLEIKHKNISFLLGYQISFFDIVQSLI